MTQLLVNEVIRGQLTPKLRMVDMPFQNVSVDNPIFWYIVFDESIEMILGEPTEFEVTEQE